MSAKKLFLLDGHALVYRAHYAFVTRPLINSKGLNTSAITGFTRTLWDLMQQQRPTHLAVAFDPPTPTFRHEMYVPYKANREAQPEDISIAIPYIRQILAAWKIPVVMVDTYEADDVIGTLAKQAEKEGFDVYMVTPDKDFGQLVSPHIFHYKPARMGNDIDILGEKEVMEKWDIQRIDQVIDMLGLMGDSVDNIPGIPGIGEKTACKLLKEFGTVEELIRRADELKGKQRENIINFAEQGLLSKQLATIDINVPIQFDAEQFLLDPFDREALTEIFKELEFRTLAAQILNFDAERPSKPNAKSDKSANAPASAQGLLFGAEEMEGTAVAAPAAPAAHSVADKNIGNTPHSYHLVDTPAAMQALVAQLAAHAFFSFDTETTHIEPNLASLVGMSFAVKAQEAWYVPVPEEREAAQAVVELFRPLLEDERIEKIGQNLKYDAIVLKWYGIDIKGPCFDTMIAHYLLEPELRHNMNYLSETYLRYEPVSIDTLIGKKGKGQITMRDVPVEKVKEYAAEDADITLQLRDYLVPRIQAEGLHDLYSKLEAPLIRVLTDIEYEGIRIDPDFLADYSKELAVEVVALEDDIFKQVGVQFNLASPKQVGEILFDHLKIPYRWQKTKTGQYSTDEEKLSEMAGEHPVIDGILRHRSLTKLRSTYVDALPPLINPKTGRLHTSFNQALTATGRLSSNNPNLQNIPVRTPEGAKVRKAFIPRDADYVLMASDYSQIELRLIAEISGDPAMLSAFQAGQDIHTATAAGVFSVPYDEVTREQRYRAKTVNFSIIYGAGATNLSRQLDLKRTEAKDLIDNYFKQYPGLKNYMDETVAKARENGFVTTLMGRRRYLRDINSRNGVIRSHAERNAVNTPIQGTAADLIKLAMIDVHRILSQGKYRTKMILQVHDELVFDAHRDEVEVLRPLIEAAMRDAMPNLKVPILVETGMGEHWLEAH